MVGSAHLRSIRGAGQERNGRLPLSGGGGRRLSTRSSPRRELKLQIGKRKTRGQWRRPGRRAANDEGSMTTPAKIGKWVSESQWRLYPLFLLLMVLPIAFFAYSVGQLLRHQTETQAATESTQIARVSAALVEEHFRQSTAFLRSE